MKLKYIGALLASCFLVTSFEVFGTEIHLAAGEVIDLDALQSQDGSYRFDEVTMDKNSVILVPSGRSSIKLSIDKLRTNGVAYIALFADPKPIFPPKPPKDGRAPDCANGASGKKGQPGTAPQFSTSLDITIGIVGSPKIIVLAQGINGGSGGTGGDGQDGGHSGGKERCVIQRCNGGDGGPPGNGGDSGSGGAGSKVALNISGLAKGDIQHIDGSEYTQPPEFNFLLAKSLAGVELKEKVVGSSPKKSTLFTIFKTFVDRNNALSSVNKELGYEVSELDKLIQKNLLVINPGGMPGAVGYWGRGGGGGNGYFCTIGPDQAKGQNNYQSGEYGKNGAVGAPGVMIVNKLD